MIILAVDTALGQESVAILRDGEVIAFSQGTENSLQAERLFEHISNVFAKTKMGYENIDHFAVDIGPGSFTGIRIGLSAILGICLAQGKEMLGISSLEALAYKSGKNKVHTVLNAGRNELYSQEFEINNSIIKNISKAELLRLDSLTSADIGNLAFCAVQTLPDARDIGIAANLMIKNNIADFSRKSPIYIRQPDAKIKVKN